MSTMQLSREGSVWILTLTNGENRLNDDVIAEYHAALDTVEHSEGNGALIITSADPKFWSNGIDLNFVQEKGGMAYLVKEFAPRLDQLLLRIALFPLPVIACLTGHAYAGGALIAAACDFRTMRADRGRFCFPEVDIKIPFTPIMTEIVRLLPNPNIAWHMAITGLALGGEEAAAAGVVDKALGQEALWPTTLAWATELAKKDRQTYALIKRRWRHQFAQFQPR
ncbi:enoyl-CoA hydratase/isomerase family protein [Agitococcus lubricus]|uniref:Enoyl-CoA hydratase/carnithine racemase n=1 Tax=Agitococcus lubricus TaxID=1077255 RepID=A0A2T5IYC4_9GAMM|nr:enoyl-CoA hydratase/isomerase family protein [Agitococcus lubricus]PTQ88998.1 enoyl-CoA hydratase/carnithine racemase [Agitococcus lubricus]